MAYFLIKHDLLEIKMDYRAERIGSCLPKKRYERMNNKIKDDRQVLKFFCL